MAAPSSGSAAVQTPFTIVLNWQAALESDFRVLDLCIPTESTGDSPCGALRAVAA